MRYRWRWSLAVVVAWTIAWAIALELPRDAEVLLTDASSRIVGVGHSVAGTRFELRLEDGFEGPAVLVWFEPDGTVGRLEVVVQDEVVWVDGRDLRTLLPASFVDVQVTPASKAAPPGAAHGRGEGGPPGLDRAPQGPPDDAPTGPPDDVPRNDAADPPASPPGQERAPGGGSSRR